MRVGGDMLAASYRSREDDEDVVVPGQNNKDGEEPAEDKAREFIHRMFGNTLDKVLIDCAKEQPEDPIAFISEALKK